ncbi:N6-adenosine-methyltransferase subunit METTL3 isoform X2 [Hydra vulgaris]|uniref:N6-adenosine-methyltransferase subunit METTL3 isoform X2 n=1 Tax=Hydra vulgaris TaxID=6087 RepID=UPI001F5E4FB2|nr:N6-adenosine-methyltransferase subunit METTL3 isoform X2 [Hydra vulgaris]
MSDTWSKLQAHKRKQESLREMLAKKRKERQVLLESTSAGDLNKQDLIDEEKQEKFENAGKLELDLEAISELEKYVALELSKKELVLPLAIEDLHKHLEKLKGHSVNKSSLMIVIEKLEAQNLVSVKRTGELVTIFDCEYVKLRALLANPDKAVVIETSDVKKTRDIAKPEADDQKDLIASLLSIPTMRESENKKIGNEILDLLNQKTAKEQSLIEKFKSQGGAMVHEFCPFGTREECRRSNSERKRCKKLHFKKIIQAHTDEFLGDCSFLNTCFHMDTCKYVHYEVEQQGSESLVKSKDIVDLKKTDLLGGKIMLMPPQWIQCDVRTLDLDVIGKFSVIMADPPWDIHMELPYGTMADHEMKQLQVGKLQDDGYIFLWVTGRAIELGRECLEVWGYKRVDELIWVKTNQLQRLIRTGRTGHWINHGKEHCIIGVKGRPDSSIFNKGLDCDVLVSEVRDTSHKPDEIYGLIERLAPGQRKLEIFGRQHNVQPNWITLGNQLSGVNLIEPSVVKRFKEKYPSGTCMEPDKKPIPTIIDAAPQQVGSV